MKKNSSNNARVASPVVITRDAIGKKRRQLIAETSHVRVLSNEAKRLGDVAKHTELSQLLVSSESFIEYMTALENVKNPEVLNKSFVREKLLTICDHADSCVRVVGNHVLANQSPSAINRKNIHWAARLK